MQKIGSSSIVHTFVHTESDRFKNDFVYFRVGMKNYTSLLFMCLYAVLNAQTVTWTGATDTDWHKACNWSSSTIPTCLQDVVVPTGSTPTISGIAHCKTIELQGASVLDISGSGNLEVSDNNSCAGTATDNGGCASTIIATDNYGLSCYGTWTGSGIKVGPANIIFSADGTWRNSAGTYSGPPTGTYSGNWLSGAPTTPVNVEWRLSKFTSSTTPFSSPGSAWVSPVSVSAWGTTSVNASIQIGCPGGSPEYMGIKMEWRNATTLALIATHYWSVDLEC